MPLGDGGLTANGCDHRTPWLSTHLPDGHHVHAHPTPDADYHERVHDLLHLQVARACGQPTSPALQAAAHQPHDPLLVTLDEACVAALTRYLRAVEQRT